MQPGTYRLGIPCVVDTVNICWVTEWTQILTYPIHPKSLTLSDCNSIECFLVPSSHSQTEVFSNDPLGPWVLVIKFSIIIKDPESHKVYKLDWTCLAMWVTDKGKCKMWDVLGENLKWAHASLLRSSRASTWWATVFPRLKSPTSNLSLCAFILPDNHSFSFWELPEDSIHHEAGGTIHMLLPLIFTFDKILVSKN